MYFQVECLTLFFYFLFQLYTYSSACKLNSPTDSPESFHHHPLSAWIKSGHRLRKNYKSDQCKGQPKSLPYIINEGKDFSSGEKVNFIERKRIDQMTDSEVKQLIKVTIERRKKFIESNENLKSTESGSRKYSLKPVDAVNSNINYSKATSTTSSCNYDGFDLATSESWSLNYNCNSLRKSKLPSTFNGLTTRKAKYSTPDPLISDSKADTEGSLNSLANYYNNLNEPSGATVRPKIWPRVRKEPLFAPLWESQSTDNQSTSNVITKSSDQIGATNQISLVDE